MPRNSITATTAIFASGETALSSDLHDLDLGSWLCCLGKRTSRDLVFPETFPMGMGHSAGNNDRVCHPENDNLRGRPGPSCPLTCRVTDAERTYKTNMHTLPHLWIIFALVPYCETSHKPRPNFHVEENAHQLGAGNKGTLESLLQISATVCVCVSVFGQWRCSEL